ncbi:hypothetical protein TELCIR_20216, partial [Teladorsagia circumcincta]
RFTKPGLANHEEIAADHNLMKKVSEDEAPKRPPGHGTEWPCNSAISKAMANPRWKETESLCTGISPNQEAMEIAAAMGFGNARSLASLFSLFVNRRIVSDKTLGLVKRPLINATDYVLNSNTVKGHGFFYYPPLLEYEKDFMIGHSGYGCQQVMFDMTNKIAFAYVTNGLKLGVYDLCRNYVRIQTALYGVLKDFNGM